MNLGQQMKQLAANRAKALSRVVPLPVKTIEVVKPKKGPYFYDVFKSQPIHVNEDRSDLVFVKTIKAANTEAAFAMAQKSITHPIISLGRGNP
jgi:hypothetical protein